MVRYAALVACWRGSATAIGAFISAVGDRVIAAVVKTVASLRSARVDVSVRIIAVFDRRKTIVVFVSLT
jgi:hypothetical protein